MIIDSSQQTYCIDHTPISYADTEALLIAAYQTSLSTGDEDNLHYTVLKNPNETRALGLSLGNTLRAHENRILLSSHLLIILSARNDSRQSPVDENALIMSKVLRSMLHTASSLKYEAKILFGLPKPLRHSRLVMEQLQIPWIFRPVGGLAVTNCKYLTT